MTLQTLFDQAITRHRAGDLPGAEQLYRRLVQTAPGHFGPLQALGVLCAQQGRSSEALEYLQASLRLNPGAADAQFNYGKVLKGLGRLEDAVAAFTKALAARDDYPAARIARAETLNQLGIDVQQQGRLGHALAAYDGALADVPGYSDAINNRATLLAAMGRQEEALAGFDQALAIRPGYIETHYNRANILRDMLRLDEALEGFDRAIALDPQFAPAWRNKAFTHLMQGDLAQGLPLYEWRKKLAQPIEARHFPQPLWTGAQDINGKTVFTYVEQGLGDTIQFYRFVATLLARGARVIAGVQDALLPLLADGRWPVTLISNRMVPQELDFHIPLASVPLAAGMRMNTIPADTPYLKAQPQRVAQWRMRIGNHGFKIGIAWQGAVGVPGRAMPLEHFAGLAQLPGVRLISLQKGAGAEQLAALPQVESLGAAFDAGPGAFLDSAAVMESLDLVITLDSALAHLAGALRRPVWLALKRAPDWRWFLGRDDSPWYPDMRLFRQAQGGDWAGVFADMEAVLKEMLA